MNEKKNLGPPESYQRITDFVKNRGAFNLYRKKCLQKKKEMQKQYVLCCFSESHETQIYGQEQ